jgi:hypothetical protein
MKSDLSPRDWQEISSYLDRQISVEAQARLEERLKNEQDLRNALEDLHRAQALLRSQPRLRAPRNFTLTREMAGKRSGAPAYPVLGLASALASLLFIFLLVGDLFSQRAALAPSQMTNALQAEMAQSEAVSPQPSGTLDEAEATQAMELNEAAPMAAPLAAPLAITEAPLETQLPAAAAKVMAPPPTSGDAAASPPAEATLAAILPPAKQAAQLAPTASPVQDSGGRAPEKTSLPLPPTKIFGLNQTIWHASEILAAILAVATGMAWWIRRRRY